MKRFFVRLTLCAMAFAALAACSGSDEVDVTLAVPANVRCSVRGDKSLTFAWEAVDGATGYRYQFTDADGKTIRATSVAETTLTMSELTPSTGYRFRVQSYNDKGGESAYSEYVSVATAAEGEGEKAMLDTPKPSLRSATDEAVTIEWGAVSGAAGYAYMLTSADGAMVVKEAETTTPLVTIDGLAAETTYGFAVKALAGKSTLYVDSDYSQTLAVTTDKQGERPDSQVTLKLPAHEQDGVIRAFPGAEGAGMYTTGGRGGAVYHVTNLNDSGAGSLRDALSKSGARTIVFDVAGVIELQSTLEIKNGNVTIAGQTAPGDGICLKNCAVNVKTDQVIIRYVRFRPGDGSSDDGLDAIWGRYRHHIILDHCSMSWSTDECSSFYANRNFTMQWCLLGESLHNTRHTKGSHGYGGIWGGAPASFHHNVLAHHDSRNPRFDSPNTYAPNSSDNPTMNVEDRRIDYRNNVVYNFCNYPAYGGEGQKFNFVGNIYKWGPASYNGAGVSYKLTDGKEVESANKACRRQYFYSVDGSYTTGGKTYDYGYAHIYYGDNTNRFDSSVSGSTTVGDNLSANNKSGFVKAAESKVTSDITWLSTPLSIQDGSQNCYVTTHDAGQLMGAVCQYVGASKKRDVVDTRLADDVLNGKATVAKGSRGSQNGIIDSQNDVGGWPVYAATEEELKRTVDTDGDGIPDYYEELFGLNPADKADGNAKTLDPQRLYTNLEIYLHYLVQDIVEAQNAAGVYTELK